MHREESRHDFAFMAGVIIGAVSGALATLALTPMSGQETREKLRERAIALDLEPVKERAAGVATTAQHLMETGRERAADLVAKSPLPFGEAHEPEDREVATTAAGMATTHASLTTTTSESPASTGYGAGAHTQTPTEGARDAGQGNGVVDGTNTAGEDGLPKATGSGSSPD
jgi:hypothetical protein